MITKELLEKVSEYFTVEDNILVWNKGYKMRKVGTKVPMSKPLRFDSYTLSARFLLNYIINGSYSMDQKLYPNTLTKVDKQITHTQLLQILYYNGNTGLFTWKESRGIHANKGSIAGYLHHSGYRYIEISGTVYSLHRLAWFYTYGTWPTKDIDHIDRDKTNNTISNLREATHSENMRNRSIGINNTSGFLGVSPYKNKWRASFVLDGKPKHIGYFNTPEEASIAYENYKENS